MVRGTLERVFDPEKLERVFADNRVLQYTRELTFASVWADVGCCFSHRAERRGVGQGASRELAVTRQAVTIN